MLSKLKFCYDLDFYKATLRYVLYCNAASGGGRGEIILIHVVEISEIGDIGKEARRFNYFVDRSACRLEQTFDIFAYLPGLTRYISFGYCAGLGVGGYLS